jgi:hypothetical protein
MFYDIYTSKPHIPYRIIIWVRLFWNGENEAYAYGLAAAGEAGIERAIEILRADLDRTLRLLGCPSISALDRSYVTVSIVAAAVPIVCRSGAGRRHADGSRSDVVVSGVADSGRERRHGSIDTNNPSRDFWPTPGLQNRTAQSRF